MSTSNTYNPYESTQVELIDPQVDAIGEIRYFSPSCRIGRLRYWAHACLLMLASYLLMFVVAALMALLAADLVYVFFIAIFMATVPIVVVWWIFVIQRLHDLNLSGWVSLLMLVPFLNMFMSLFLVLWPGTSGTNRFGAKPPPNSWWHWLPATLGLLMVVGMVAAVALPAYQDYVLRAQG